MTNKIKRNRPQYPKEIQSFQCEGMKMGKLIIIIIHLYIVMSNILKYSKFSMFKKSIIAKILQIQEFFSSPKKFKNTKVFKISKTFDFCQFNLRSFYNLNKFPNFKVKALFLIIKKIRNVKRLFE